MDEKDSERALDDLGARLKRAREAHEAPARKAAVRAETAGMGQAFRIGVEMLSALVVGTGIGWFLDDWLGTRPWLLILFIFLGGAAGILNVYRTAMTMAPKAADGAENGPEDATEKDSGVQGREN